MNEPNYPDGYPPDSRYAPLDYTPKSDSDLIDFPVSDFWWDYYFEKQMTPTPSPKYYMQQDTDALTEQLERLRLTIASRQIKWTIPKVPLRTDIFKKGEFKGV